MSLELALERNTAAINALVEVLKNAAPAPVEEPAAPEPKAPAKRNTKKAASPEQIAPSPDAGATDASATAAVAAPAVSYADLQKVVLAFIGKHGKPAALAIAHKAGLDSFKSAKPEQYAELKAVVEAEI